MAQEGCLGGAERRKCEVVRAPPIHWWRVFCCPPQPQYHASSSVSWFVKVWTLSSVVFAVWKKSLGSIYETEHLWVLFASKCAHQLDHLRQAKGKGPRSKMGPGSGFQQHVQEGAPQLQLVYFTYTYSLHLFSHTHHHWHWIERNITRLLNSLVTCCWLVVWPRWCSIRTSLRASRRSSADRLM